MVIYELQIKKNKLFFLKKKEKENKMGSILAPASSALGALGGVASGLSQIVQRTLQLVAAPFALIGNTAGAAGSVLAGGEVAVSSTIESPVQSNEALQGGEQALGGDSALVGGGETSALVGGETPALDSSLVGGQSTIVEAPVFIPLQNQFGMSGGARSRKRRASSPKMKHGRKGTRSKSRSRRSGGKKKITQKSKSSKSKKASPRRHRM